MAGLGTPAINPSSGAVSATITSPIGQKAMAASIAVAIASDQTAIPVTIGAGSAVIGHVITDATSVTNATLTAETTKAIGVVRNSDGAGNLLTSNSTTPSGKFSLDSNITSILGTAPTTVGKLDIKGADGDVFVRQTTGTNLHVVVDSGTISTITNVVHVDDNAGSLTVDNAGTFAVQADTELPAAAALADDTVNPTTPSVGALGLIWDPNDSNWDRVRGINATLNQAAADSGITAVGLTAQFDDTSPTTVTENSWGNLRVSANRNLYNTIRDAAGSERGLNVAATGNISIDTVTTVTTVSTVSALGIGTTGPMKAEDVASVTGDMGIPAYAIRLDTPVSGANVNASGDYLPLITDSFGKLWTTGAYLEDSAHTSGDIGTVGLAVRETTPTDLSAGATDGDYEPLQVNAQGALWVTATPSTTGGWTPSIQNALSTTVKVVKASAGSLGGWYMYNPNGAVAYVQIFDISGAVTLGTSTPVLSLAIPPGAAANVENANGINFANAIKVAATTTATGLTATATALDCNFWYK